MFRQKSERVMPIKRNFTTETNADKDDIQSVFLAKASHQMTSAASMENIPKVPTGWHGAHRPSIVRKKNTMQRLMSEIPKKSAPTIIEKGLNSLETTPKTPNPMMAMLGHALTLRVASKIHEISAASIGKNMLSSASNVEDSRDVVDDIL